MITPFNLFNEWDARTDVDDPITVTAQDIDAAPLLFQTPRQPDIIDMRDPALWLDDIMDVLERIARDGKIAGVRSW